MKYLSLNAKIAGILVVLIGMSILIAWIGLRDLANVNARLNNIVDSTAAKIRLGARINQNLLEISRAEKNMILATTEEQMKGYQKEIVMAKKELTDRESQIRTLLDQANVEKLDKFDVAKEAYFAHLEKIQELALINSNIRAKDLSQGAARDKFDIIEQIIRDIGARNESRFEQQQSSESAKGALIAARSLQDLLIIQRAEKNIILSDSQESMDQYAAVIDESLASAQSRLKTLRTVVDTKDRAALDKFEPLFQDWLATHKSVRELARENSNTRAFAISSGDARKALDEAQSFLTEIVNFNDKQLDLDKVASDKNYEEARLSVLITVVSGIAVSVLLSILTMLGIGRAIRRVIDNLKDSSTQVSSASVQLSNAAQELSSMANEQASSIEETSSSLEEMSGMVDNNLQNTQSTVDMVESVSKASQLGDELMTQVEGAINQIHDSNERIKDLVKVIANIGEKTQIMDEIVFQTKLLSFNASVEAERAGEHGRGFAVVAQEVGNLATMSGKAAQEISVIVKDSIKEAEGITEENRLLVERGVNHVKDTSVKLKEIVGVSKDVVEKANQVLTASREQATGVRQITAAINQLDKATQENAATAEETASTSEELSAQTDVLSQVVLDLTSVIYGANSVKKEASAGKPIRTTSPSNSGSANKGRVISIDKFKKSSNEDQSAVVDMKRAVGAENLRSMDNLAANAAEDGWDRL